MASVCQIECVHVSSRRAHTVEFQSSKQVRNEKQQCQMGIGTRKRQTTRECEREREQRQKGTHIVFLFFNYIISITFLSHFHLYPNICISSHPKFVRVYTIHGCCLCFFSLFQIAKNNNTSLAHNMLDTMFGKRTTTTLHWQTHKQTHILFYMYTFCC